MRASTRERVLRTLLSAFINSSLTPQELEELLDEISVNSKLREDLRRAFSAVSSALHDERRQKELHPTELSSVHQILDLVKQRRLSKDEVLRVMIRAAPSLTPKLALDNATLRDIIRDFWARASVVERSKFIALFAPKGSVGSDEYLQGIFEKR
jgi:hypothetical protein